MAKPTITFIRLFTPNSCMHGTYREFTVAAIRLKLPETNIYEFKVARQ